MKLMTLIIFMLFSDLMIAVNIHQILYTLVDRKRANTRCYILVAVHLAFNLSINLKDDRALNITLLVIAAVFLYLSMLSVHRKEPLKTLYVMLLYLCLDSLMAPLVTLGISIFTPIGSMTVKSISCILNVAFFLLFTRCVSRRADEIRFSLTLLPVKFYALILVYIFSLACFCSFIEVLVKYNNMNFELVYTVVRVMLILISLISLMIILIMIANGISRYYYEESSRLLDKQLDLQVKYYEKIEQMSVETRKFRHDYNNHMTCLASLLESGKVEEAREYLGTISAHPSMKRSSYKSGNPIADAVLNDKASAAAAEGCRLEFTGAVSERVSAFDICTILSNALDNSIEACRKADSGAEKVITVKCVFRNDTQVISISNPSQGVDAQLKTTKEDKDLHGFGLNNIRKTVEAMNGTMEISQTSPMFVLDVMFTVPKTAQEDGGISQ